MYQGYEQDRQYHEREDFRFKARIYKVLWTLGAAVFGFFFLPMMAVWDAGSSATAQFAADFRPVDGVGYLLLAIFVLTGFLFGGLGWLFVRNWEYHSGPVGYNAAKLW